MTMPKKGVRKIVVDGKTYKYIIKPYGSKSWRFCKYKPGVVTIESPEGKYYQDKNPLISITPAYVEKVIKEKMQTFAGGK